MGIDQAYTSWRIAASTCTKPRTDILLRCALHALAADSMDDMDLRGLKCAIEVSSQAAAIATKLRTLAVPPS